MADTTAPTADELAAARAVMDRQALIDTAAVAEQKQPLKDFTETDAFKEALAKAKELRDALPTGTPFYAHLNAIVIGMSNLATDVG